jgi:hypothetical protein
MKKLVRNLPKLRGKPKEGTVIRMPFAEGGYVYALVVHSQLAWVFDFITLQPAFGAAFFDLAKVSFPARPGLLPIQFVDCARLSKSSLDKLPVAEFYERLPKDMQDELGYKTPNAVWEGSGYLPYREVTKDEIRNRGLWPDKILSNGHDEKLIRCWRKRMTVREVPEEHVDHAALAAASRPMEEDPPLEVELIILMPQAELRTDDPEPDLEEPLAGYLTEFECGEVTGSGTTPGYFEINVETTQDDLTRCLNLTRRTLKHLKAPASTIIRVLSEPPVDHPLNPLKKTTQKK